MFAALHAAGNVELLLDCARHFTPRVEQTSSDTIALDLSGLDKLFGPPQQIAEGLANRAGIPVHVATADDLDAAVYAARGIAGITVIESGKEAQILAPLPVNLLPGSPEAADALHSWGIRTFGQLAALPPLGIAARLGEEGTHLQRLARGDVGRHLRDVIDPLRFEEYLEVDSPVELLEPLSFLLSRMLNELTTKLRAHGLSANAITLKLILEGSSPHCCYRNVPVPVIDSKVFLKLLQLELSARPPMAPVVAIRLHLTPTPPRPEQNGLFVPLAPEPEKLEITLARLQNLLGAGNVGSPEVTDTHRPDSFDIVRFAAKSTAELRQAPPRETPVLRRFRPPKYARVLLKENRPVHVSSMHIESKVMRASGPWQTSGDWWQAEPWDQQHWDVELGQGLYYRLFEDCRTHRWFLAGAYD